MTEQSDQILEHAPAGISLFLDFDGVLVDIAPSPDAIVVPPGLPGLLRRLDRALGGALAVVSGRPLAEIDAFLAGAVPTVFGSHGAQFRFEGRTGAPDPELAATAGQLARLAEAAFGRRDGILVEPKPAGVAVHYRKAPGAGPEIEQALSRAIADRPGFEVLAGKMVYEARPVGLDKGGAVRALMERPPFSGRLPVFVGDDVTDEDGMAEALARGGFAIKVGEGETRAPIRVPDPASLRELLSRLAATAPLGEPGTGTLR